jgi:RimJ/RimL family protein N-acetyltransferase
MPPPDADDRTAPDERRWSSEVVLTDGTTVLVRPIRSADRDRHRRFADRLSDESQYLRFFQPRHSLTAAEREHFCTVDYVDRLAFVGVIDDEIVAVARYERLDETSAEVAFVVADEWQGRGLGTILLERLAEAARRVGIDRFTADVLAENRAMLSVFQDAGFGYASHLESGGTIHVALDLDPTDRLREAIQGRRDAARAARRT